MGENDALILSSRSAREVHFKEPDEVGTDMAEFAVGSISTMARTKDQIQVDSLVPHLRSHPEVKWYYVIPPALVALVAPTWRSLC